jgi:hypothetical protein
MDFTIGPLKFVWNQNLNDLHVYLNGHPWSGVIRLTHCDTEPLVRQFCKSYAVDFWMDLGRAYAAFDTMGREPRDRHL